MSDTQRERELKFDVPDDWDPPDPSRLLPPGGSVEHESQQLESTYYDTDERDLLACGLTLRRRTGDADTGWQLKVPDGDARIEVRVPLLGRGVPEEIRRVTGGVRGRSALKPIATLRTERGVQRLRAADGAALAEIVFDRVVAHTQREFAVTRSWHEVEVELVEGGEKLLARSASWLRKQGATDAESGSKLARALDTGPRGGRDVGRLSGLVGAYLDEQFAALVRGDVQLRRDADVVHPTRVATRRYRSVLRVFATMFDAERAAALDTELAWYAAALGRVRDTQVLRAHLSGSLDDFPAEVLIGPVAIRMAAALDADESAARQALGEVMADARYRCLLAELRAWQRDLPVVVDGAATEVADYLHRAERTLAKRLRQARAGDHGDESHHRARKAAKRTRYAAELSRPALGKPAAKTMKRAKAVQQRLGDRQDNALAAQFLLRVGTVPGRNGFTFGAMFQRELARERAID